MLALDTGSPVTSVAVARGERLVAEVACPSAARAGGGAAREGSSETVLALVDAALARAGATPRSLDAVCVLRGPGSFTGLRIGLATALGLHQALGVRAAAMPTLHVLAEAGGADRVLAVVDALRGEWFAQSFRRLHASGGSLEAEGPAELLRADALRAKAPRVVVGFGADRLANDTGLDATQVVLPSALAGIAALLALRWTEWDPALLTEPLYLRPAPATAPRRGPRGRRDEPDHGS